MVARYRPDRRIADRKCPTRGRGVLLIPGVWSGNRKLGPGLVGSPVSCRQNWRRHPLLRSLSHAGFEDKDEAAVLGPRRSRDSIRAHTAWRPSARTADDRRCGGLIIPDECHAGARGTVRRNERLGGMLDYYKAA